jgi:hypothetical protein
MRKVITMVKGNESAVNISTEANGEGKVIGRGIGFVRVRRVTGYCGTLDKFNNAKRAEIADRVKHA